MSALSTLGQRQQSLLQALLENKNGLTVDEISHELTISRNAVNQHLTNLETNGFIENTSMTDTGGRPSKVYSLSSNGRELFPRHYSLFSNLLLHWIKNKSTDYEFSACLKDLGIQIAQDYKLRVQQQQTRTDKITEVTNILNELGYEAHTGELTDSYSEIIAKNCVFHQIAEDCNDVCKLDLTLLTSLLQSNVEHKECMVKGGNCCRFSITK